MSEALQKAIAAAEAVLSGALSSDRSRFQRLSNELGLAEMGDASTLGYLAILLDCIGFRDESAQILRYGYDKFSNSDGTEEAILHNIEGMLATEHGKYQNALIAFEQALPLAQDAIDIRAKIIANIAAVNMRAGHAVDALTRISVIRDIQNRISPSLELASTSVEADAALRADDVDALRRAADNLYEAAKRRIAELGTDHPQAVTIIAQLAAVELDVARAEGSTDRLQAVMELLEAVSCRLAAEFGVDHPQTLVALANVASAQMDLAIWEGTPQRMERAISSLRTVSQHVESVLGAEHPHSLAVAANLAASQLELARADMSGDRLRQAVDTLASVADRMSDALGSNHPDTVQVLANLASAKLDLARSQASTDALMQTAELLTVTAECASRVLGSSHRITQLVRSQLRVCQSLLTGDLPTDLPARDLDVRVNSDQAQLQIREKYTPYHVAVRSHASGADPSEPHAAPAVGPAGADRLLFRMLGPLKVRAGEQWQGIGAPKWRSVLAVLLINSGQVVSVETLINEVWGSAAPQKAANLIAIYVLRLRRLLGDTADSLLVTRAPGYQLQVTTSETDSQLFENMVRAGRQALIEGDPEHAASQLVEALALWYGSPFADVPPSTLVDAEGERLVELKLDAIELRITAELAIRSYAEVVPELRRLLADHPLREGLWLLLMRALDGSGRHAQALQAFYQARNVIGYELGVAPGPELRRAHAELLANNSPSVRDDAIGSPPRRPENRLSAQRPAQLTADIVLGTVNQHFLAAVGADSGNFGGAQTHMGSYTGRFPEREVAETIRFYVLPSMFGATITALRKEHIVVLKGPDGSGRRASAIALLRQATQGPVVALSPSITTTELAERSFNEGHSYLIAGKLEEDLSSELVDFNWRTICARLREAGAYLVMTTGEHRGGQWPSSITQVSWRQPSVADALRAHLGEADYDERLLTVVANALRPGYPMARISDLARRISAGESAESLLDEVTDAKRQLIADWLDNAPNSRDILEVAGLALTGSVPEPIFDYLMSRLAEESAARTISPAEDIAIGQPGVGMPDSRRSRREHGNPVITVEQIPPAVGMAASALRRVIFRSPEYRALVLDEVWKHSDAEFWEPVRAWLHGIVADADDELTIGIASGLALLARYAPNEVIKSYLDPWAAGIAGLRGQTAAAYALWWMSMDDSVAPLALRTAVLWAGKDTQAERQTATIVFGGELGAHYATEAARQLCQLGDQGQPDAGQGLAQLFAMLADRQDEATAVLGMLVRRLSRLLEVPSSRFAMGRSLAWAIDVLTVRSPLTGRPAAATFIDANPSRLDDLAYLWAMTLHASIWRRAAIAALRDVLQALAADRSDSGTLAGSIGAAIMRRVPESDQSRLLADISTSWRSAAHEDNSESIIETFLTAFTAPTLEE